jgi:hypothetical protein
MAHPFAFVTLLTSDSYLPGALAVVGALKDVHPSPPVYPEVDFHTVCLVTPHTVDVTTIKLLRRTFNVVIGVELIWQENEKGLHLLGACANSKVRVGKACRMYYGCVRHLIQLRIFVELYSVLDMLVLHPSCLLNILLVYIAVVTNPPSSKSIGRPDLQAVLTKLHIFRLTQYSKIIFLDADVLPIRPLSHLFHIPHPFSAVPDVGWPDIFNSGVLVVTPGEDQFKEVRAVLTNKGSWDGGDQGVLNEWRGNDWHRLSFTYNTTSTAAYTCVCLLYYGIDH